jgi:hypothetical protein
MNKKGEESPMGLIIAIFIAVIVALVLYQSIAQTVGTSTTSGSLVNVTYLSSVSANGTVTVGGRDNGVLSVAHAANGTVVTSLFALENNYVNNQQVIQLKTTDAAVANKWYNGTNINITYTYNPTGYMDSSASRTTFLLVVIMAAIGIAVVALRGIKLEGLS